MIIPIGQIPEFYKDCTKYANKLVIALLVGWRPSSYLPLGKFIRVVGEAGDIYAETEALLAANGIQDRNFSPQVMEELPAGNSSFLISFIVDQ